MPENENTSIHKYYIYNALKEDTSDKEIVCLIIDKGEGKSIYECIYLIPSPEIAGDKRGEIIECLKNLKKDRKLSKDQKSLFRVVYMCNLNRSKIAEGYRVKLRNVTNDLKDGKFIKEFNERKEIIEGLSEFEKEREKIKKQRKDERDESGEEFRLIKRGQTDSDAQKIENELEEEGLKIRSKHIIEAGAPIIMITDCEDGKPDKIIELHVYKKLKESKPKNMKDFLSKINWDVVKLSNKKRNYRKKSKSRFKMKEKGLNGFFRNKLLDAFVSLHEKKIEQLYKKKKSK